MKSSYNLKGRVSYWKDGDRKRHSRDLRFEYPPFARMKNKKHFYLIITSIIISLLLLNTAFSEEKKYSDMSQQEKQKYLAKKGISSNPDNVDYDENSNKITVKKGNVKLENKEKQPNVKLDGGNADASSYSGEIEVGSYGGSITTKEGIISVRSGEKIKIIDGRLVSMKNTDLEKGSTLSGKQVSGYVEEYDMKTNSIKIKKGKSITINKVNIFSDSNAEVIINEDETLNVKGNNIHIGNLKTLMPVAQLGYGSLTLNKENQIIKIHENSKVVEYNEKGDKKVTIVSSSGYSRYKYHISPVKESEEHYSPDGSVSFYDKSEKRGQDILKDSHKIGFWSKELNNKKDNSIEFGAFVFENVFEPSLTRVQREEEIERKVFGLYLRWKW